MKKGRCLVFAVGFGVSACAVYDQQLIGNGTEPGAGGTQTSGGSSSLGGVEDSAARTPSAGRTAAGAGGHAPSNGGSSEAAGAAEEPSAGATSEGQGGASVGGASHGGTSGLGGGKHAGGTSAGGKAGTSAGGASAGTSAGGASAGTSAGGKAGTGAGGASAGTSAGGKASGGGGGASAGSAGTSAGGVSGAGGSPVGDALVDNMQHTTATYANSPFTGSWSRVASGDMVWVNSDVPSMFHKRADSATDMSLRVAASCPASGNCASSPSDVEVIVTLNNGAAVDLSAYTGISFSINRVANTGAILRVAFDDGPSHLGSTSCSDGTQADCGRESEQFVAPNPYAVSSGAWTKYQLPFSSFAKNCGWMCTRQNALSVKEVYSLRFRVDRNITGGSVTKIDFDVDDLYLYK